MSDQTFENMLNEACLAFEQVHDEPRRYHVDALRAALAAALAVGPTALVVRPGDVLILVTEQPVLSMQQVERLREDALRRMPGLADVVIAAGFNSAAAYRADEPRDRHGQ